MTDFNDVKTDLPPEKSASTTSSHGTGNRMRKFIAKKAIKWFVAIGGVFAIVIVGIGLSNNSPASLETPQKDEVPDKIRPVRVVQVEYEPLVRYREFPGVTKELKESKLAFRVSGPLCKFNVKIGERLAKDDVIAQIDPRDFEVAVKRVEAGLAEAEAGLKAMRKGARDEDVAALKAKLNGAKSKLHEATLFRDRFEALSKDGSVPKARFDNASASFDVAQAQVKATEKELEKAQKGARIEEIEGMEAKIAGLKAQLSVARNALNDSYLRAPFTGLVSQKYVENYETVAAGHPIVSLLDCSSLDVTAGIPEDVVIQQDHFRGFACELDAYPGRWIPAKLKEIGPAIQHGKLTYPITVTLDPPEDLIIRPGMTARVQIAIDVPSPQTNYFRLPVTATVFDEGGLPYVWVVDLQKHVVHRRTVKLGKLANDGIEVVDGLQKGEWTVTAGAAFLHEGQKVKIDGSDSLSDSKTADESDMS